MPMSLPEPRTLATVQIRCVADWYNYPGGPRILEAGQVYPAELVGFAPDDPARFYEIAHAGQTCCYDHDDPRIAVVGDAAQNDRALLRGLLGY